MSTESKKINHEAMQRMLMESSTLASALELLANNKFEHRIVKLDGKSQCMTMDWVEDRAQLEVVGNKVVGVTFG